MKIKTSFLLAGLCGVWVVLPPLPVYAQNVETPSVPSVTQDVLDGWRIQGDKVFDFSNYQTSGAAASSPYRNHGNQFYSTLNTSFGKDISPYQKINGRAGMLVNRSDYRSNFRNFTLEQFSTTWENGEAAVPFALDVGDAYAAFSPRSLEAPLKGAMIEFQPETGGAWQHSLVAVSGFDQSVWLKWEPDKSFTSGLSYLTENEAYGAINLNTVYNHKRPDAATSIKSLDQMVTTLAGSTDFKALGQMLTAEVETGLFYGDRASGTAASPELGRTDVGLYSHLDGRMAELPLNYGITYERYGADYTPAGAFVTNNQNRLESTATWRFKESGMQLTGRQMRTESNMETANPQLEHTYGMRLTGQIFPDWHQGLSGSWDGFTTNIEDKNSTVEQSLYATSLNLMQSITPELSARYGYRYRQSHNDVTSTVTIGQDHNLGFNYAWAMSGWSGTLGPGVSISETFTGINRGLQFGPLLTADAHKGGHGFNVSYQDRRTEDFTGTTAHTFNQSASGRYTYAFDNHELAFSGDYFHRDPDVGLHTDAWRVGMTYTLHFALGGADDAAGEAQTASLTQDNNSIELRDLLLGQNSAALIAKLSGAGRKGSMQGDAYVVQGSLFERISLRQRTFYQFDGSELARLGVVFEPETENAGALARDYRAIFSELVRKYGKPTTSYEDGEFSATLAEDLVNGRFRRMHEWVMNDRVFRFGIPRRLDNRIRFEFVGAAAHPAPSNPVWGFSDFQ